MHVDQLQSSLNLPPYVALVLCFVCRDASVFHADGGEHDVHVPPWGFSNKRSLYGRHPYDRSKEERKETFERNDVRCGFRDIGFDGKTTGFHAELGLVGKVGTERHREVVC